MSYVAFDGVVAMDNLATVTIVTCLAATIFYDASASQRILQYSDPNFIADVIPDFHYLDVDPSTFLTETTLRLTKKVVDQDTSDLTRLFLEGVAGVGSNIDDSVHIAKRCVHHFMHHTDEPFDFKTARNWVDEQGDGLLCIFRSTLAAIIARNAGVRD